MAAKRATRRMENMEVMQKMTGVLTQVGSMEKALNDVANENRQLASAYGSASQQRQEAEFYFRQLTIAMKNAVKKRDDLAACFEAYAAKRLRGEPFREQFHRDFNALSQVLDVIRADLQKHLSRFCQTDVVVPPSPPITPSASRSTSTHND